MSDTPALRAAELDAADPLAGYRSRFRLDGDVTAYLDGNSLGRPLLDVADRLAAFVQGPWGQRLIRSWDESWMDEPLRVGDRLGAVVLGAAPGQTFVGDSTSVLLYKLIRAAVDADPQRTELVIDESNFPTDRYIVTGIAEQRGLSIRWLHPDPIDGVTAADLAGVVGERTALVVLSHVGYRSGSLADGAGITAAVHDHGALMLWDLSHSVASVPVELDAWQADLAVGCTYKYLNGGPGSPAFGYVRSELQPRLVQPIWGWMGAADPFDMTAGYRAATGIRRFLSGTPAILAMQPLQAMLELIAEVGMSAVREKSLRLTQFACDLVAERLEPLGVQLSTPTDPARRGSHVTVDHPAFAALLPRLWARGVVPDFRPPTGLRLGLSPLSTSFTELALGVEAIRAGLADVGPVDADQPMWSQPRTP